jgi:biotin synthase-like enzyme
MVSSGRGPSNKDIDKVVEMTEALKDEYPGVEVCACLGLLKDGQAERLKAAGVDAYNHNINTAESNHDNIVQTHTYADRVDTIGKAKSAGLSPCSGLIAGLGETDEQLVEALFALKALESDSIPVNFLMPFDGTPYENTWELSPAALREDPRHGALRVPRQGDPHRRRPRDAPALAAGAWRCTSPTRSSSVTTSPRGPGRRGPTSR